MSRRIDRPVRVAVDDQGAPVRVDGGEVLCISGFHREWIGALEGEPERDVWRVETARGLMEIHHVHPPTEEIDCPPGTWLLARWED